MACDCPFLWFDLLPFLDGGSVLNWSFKANATIPDGSTVTVQVSRHDTPEAGAWTTLGTVPALTGTYTDNPRRIFGVFEQLYYRLRLDSLNCFSDSIPAEHGEIPCPARNVLREIIRRERLRHSNHESQRGTLLKRKKSGTLCTACVNPDNPNEQIRSNCDVCFDTGYVGGYFVVPNFYLDMANYGRALLRGEFVPDEGSHTEAMVQYLNIPCVEPEDVWVDRQSDHRWIFESVETLSRIGSYVVTAASKVRRLHHADIVSYFPVIK